MDPQQQLKKHLLNLLKALPFILLCVGICLLIAHKYLQYATPRYQAHSKLKLDDINTGASSANLFKNFDVFSNTHKIATEVEVLTSKILLSQVLDSLDFDVRYLRVGKLKSTELYDDCPFKVSYEKNALLAGEIFDLIIHDSSHFTLNNKNQDFSVSSSFSTPITFKNSILTIEKNQALLRKKKHLKFSDKYRFEILNKELLISQYILPYLDVYPTKEEVAVIHLNFSAQNPKKASRFLNTLMRVYIEDYVENKIYAAEKTVEFIDKQLKDVNQKLTRSEDALETYRLQKRILNMRQETETDLRKIAQQKIQLTNLEMNIRAIDSLKSYMQQKNPLELAPNFEAFNDLLSTEIIKKIKAIQAEKKELLIKYTPDNEKVKALDLTLQDLTSYLNESVSNTQKNLKEKHTEIIKAIQTAERALDDLPTKERKMILLEREFNLNQKVYTFLTEKKTEAAIAAAANITFHRVLQKASTPINAAHPKRFFTLVIAGFIGLVFALGLVYIKEYLKNSLSSISEIKNFSSLGVISSIKLHKNTAQTHEDFQIMAAEILDKTAGQPSVKIGITSPQKKEGKTHIARGLSKALALMGYNVCLIDGNLRKTTIRKPGFADYLSNKATLEELYKENQSKLFVDIKAGHTQIDPIPLYFDKETPQKIEALSAEFDFVLFDMPALSIARETIKIMQLCTENLCVIRAENTAKSMLPFLEDTSKKHNIKNIKLVLNGMHKASNYTGDYLGSNFAYKANTSLLKRLSKTVKIYLNR